MKIEFIDKTWMDLKGDEISLNKEMKIKVVFLIMKIAKIILEDLNVEKSLDSLEIMHMELKLLYKSKQRFIDRKIVFVT
jgi:hypothetical protein